LEGADEYAEGIKKQSAGGTAEKSSQQWDPSWKCFFCLRHQVLSLYLFLRVMRDIVQKFWN
jgi:hypothetical protein